MRTRWILGVVLGLVAFALLSETSYPWFRRPFHRRPHHPSSNNHSPSSSGDVDDFPSQVSDPHRREREFAEELLQLGNGETGALDENIQKWRNVFCAAYGVGRSDLLVAYELANKNSACEPEKLLRFLNETQGDLEAYRNWDSDLRATSLRYLIQRDCIRASFPKAQEHFRMGNQKALIAEVNRTLELVEHLQGESNPLNEFLLHNDRLQTLTRLEQRLNDPSVDWHHAITEFSLSDFEHLSGPFDDLRVALRLASGLKPKPHRKGPAVESQFHDLTADLKQLQAATNDRALYNRLVSELAFARFLDGDPATARAIYRQKQRVTAGGGQTASPAEAAENDPGAIAVLHDLKAVLAGQEGQTPETTVLQLRSNHLEANRERGPPEGVKPLLPEAAAAGYRVPVVESATAGLAPLAQQLAEATGELQQALTPALEREMQSLEQNRSRLLHASLTSRPTQSAIRTRHHRNDTPGISCELLQLLKIPCEELVLTSAEDAKK
jgi:hypothetical protein